MGSGVTGTGRMTPEQQRKIIDWLSDCSSKKILQETKVSATLAEVRAFLREMRQCGPERIKELTKTLDKYGGHLKGCSKPICNCGWHQVLRRELTRESEALSLYE